jgi:hypothetical protein
MFSQLRFPEDYVLPPKIPDISIPETVDHCYILTLRKYYEERYQYVSTWAQGSEFTVWPGREYSEFNSEDLQKLGNRWSLSCSEKSLQRNKSVTLNHINIFQDALKNNYERILVLEDDCLFSRDFSYRLQQDAEVEADIIFLGEGLKEHEVPTAKHLGGNVYLRSNGGARCSDSFLINQKTMSLIVDPSYVLNQPIDHVFATVARKHGLVVGWSEPTYVAQGSIREVKDFLTSALLR